MKSALELGDMVSRTGRFPMVAISVRRSLARIAPLSQCERLVVMRPGFGGAALRE